MNKRQCSLYREMAKLHWNTFGFLFLWLGLRAENMQILWLGLVKENPSTQPGESLFLHKTDSSS